MPSLQQLNSSDNGPASLTKLNANFTALGTSTLTDAQVAAGATGVPGLTASGALVDKNGSSVSGDVVSLKTGFGLAGDGITDDTAKFQIAMDRINSGDISALDFGDGIYRISERLRLTSSYVTGIDIGGRSRAKSKILMATDGEPIFELNNIADHHTQYWHDFSYSWVNPQTNFETSSVFAFNGKPASNRSIYNCQFERIFGTNGYWFMLGNSQILYWGNTARGIYCATTGGFASLDGTAGCPKVSWDDVYINGGKAGEVLFKSGCHQAEYFVEVNNCAGGLLRDWSGGIHMIRQMGLEYSQQTANAILFDVRSSNLIAPNRIYATNLNLAAGVKLVLVNGDGASKIDINRIVVTAQSMGAGSRIDALAGGGTGRRFYVKEPVIPFTAFGVTPAIQMFDFGSSVTPDISMVTSWNDPSREAIVADADYTATQDGPRSIMFGKALTAARKVILPVSGYQPGQNMFSGRRFDIIKLPSAGTSYDINIYKSDGSTLVATIPAATASAKKVIRFDRSPPDGVSGGVGFWTVEQ